MNLDYVISQPALKHADVKKISEKSVLCLLEDLKKISIDEKKFAYHHLLYLFLLDIRANQNEPNSEEVADALHNLPHFLVRDLEGFEDGRFWCWLWHREELKNYLLLQFIRGLWSFRQQQRRNVT